MKTIKIILPFLLLTTSLLYSQSSIVYDNGTTIDISSGAEVCANTITVNGFWLGSGTFCTAPTDVKNTDDLNLEIPKEFSLSQNYPNPFNPTTTISYQLPKNSQVLLKIYNILGDEIATLVNEEKSAGSYTINFNASQLPSGIYFYKIQTGSFVETKKLMLLK